MHGLRAFQFNKFQCRRISIVARSSTGSGRVAIRFTTQHAVKFGEKVRIVGSGKELGDWNPEDGPELEWSDGDQWAVEVGMEPGQHDFKAVVMREDGSVVEWEGGENRTIEVPAASSELESQILEVACPWSQTTATFVSYDEEDAVARLEASNEVEASKGEEASKELEASKKAEASKVLEASKEDEAREKAEGIKKEEASTQEEASKSEVASKEKEAGKPEEARIHQVASTDAEPAGIVGSKAGEISQVDQVSDGGGLSPALAIGLLALPMVAWSEFTLKTTGCGLPPGPGGLLGAAEGISYLSCLGIAAWSLFNRITSRKDPAGGASLAQGLLPLVEGLSYAAIVVGAAILTSQVREYGYIPSALPDQNCFGEARPSMEKASRGASQGSTTTRGTTPAAFHFREGQGSQMSVSNNGTDRTFGSANVAFAVQRPLGSVASPNLAFLPGSPFLAGQAQAAASQAEPKKQEVDPMSAAMQGVQDFFFGPQQTMEELASGAEDGLSSAELEPVVEELEEAFSRLASFLSQLKSRFFGPSPSVPAAAETAAAQASSLADVPQVAVGYGWVPAGASNAARDLSLHRSDGQWADARPLGLSGSPPELRRVTMDFGTAATTAASAANNVTQNLNTTILQLQDLTAGVETAVKDISESAGKDGVDLGKLFKSVTELEEALKQAKESAPPAESLQPLLDQLDGAARELRSSGNTEEAEKVEKAAASMREAVAEDSNVLSSIDEATVTVTRQAESLPKSNQEAVELPAQEVEPVISKVEKVRELLKSAVESLSTLGSEKLGQSSEVP